MIIRILSRGKSFKGLATYLTRDQKAKTDERVAWSHTLNLANDHVPSAVDEMLWTARNAELLKQEAGVRAGGRVTENPVKHLSLNWSPEEKPTREHMIATTEDFLRHMKWQEHQAVIVAHQDKEYKHVHVMLNSVHPETGLKLDDNYDFRRAQAFALQYELEQGRIYCDQRLKEPEQREKSPPRNIWMAFQENEQEFARSEKRLRENEPIPSEERENQEKSKPISSDELKNQKNNEWKVLKEIQRAERKDFYSRGKSEFSDLRSWIYQGVREEFRPRWAEYYAAQKNRVVDPITLAVLKGGIVSDQKTVLEARKDLAYEELKEWRKQHYRDLLDEQRDARVELRNRQRAGLDNAPFIESQTTRAADRRVAAEFRWAANQTVKLADSQEARDNSPGFAENSEKGSAQFTAPNDSGMRIPTAFSLGSILGSVFTSLFNLGSSPEQPAPRTDSDPFVASAQETVKFQRLADREREDDEWRKRQRGE